MALHKELKLNYCIMEIIVYLYILEIYKLFGDICEN